MNEFLRLKKSNCKNCYKCIRNCPVKAIRFTGDQAHIVYNECILCGECFVVCPQNAKEIVSELETVKTFIQQGNEVYASIAPSFVANYAGIGIEGIRDGLKKLGFKDAEETAIGATLVKKEYDRLLENNERDVLISSCCYAVDLLIRKHYPEALPYLADVASPMVAHCKDIKRRHPQAKTVFIGPCVAKKQEAQDSLGIVDAALTYEEISEWFSNENIVLEKNMDSNQKSKARLFPVTGGIIRTMDCKNEDYTYMTVDGAQNCIAALKDILEGKVHKCFIEMSSCPGGCVRGPVMEKYHPNLVQDYLAVNHYAGKEDFEVYNYDPQEMHTQYTPIAQELRVPSEHEIVEQLHKMGKFKPEDELNCGTCGYNSCRDKAIAIFQGKADISMCLPFLKEKAEKFSDTIFNNTPNGIIVLNDRLEIQQINQAACNIVNLRNESDILGEPVERILDEKDFIDTRNTGKTILREKKFLAQYGRYITQTISYDNNLRLLVCIMNDFTNEEIERQKKEGLAKQTAELANQVVEKQMLTAQNIASLLGETTAETKIVLTKLKDTISHE